LTAIGSRNGKTTGKKRNEIKGGRALRKMERKGIPSSGERKKRKGHGNKGKFQGKRIKCKRREKRKIVGRRKKFMTGKIHARRRTVEGIVRRSAKPQCWLLIKVITEKSRSEKEISVEEGEKQNKEILAPRKFWSTSLNQKKFMRKKPKTREIREGPLRDKRRSWKNH